MGGNAEHVPARWSAATVYADMWVDSDKDPREEGPNPTGERATLLRYLRDYRLTLEMKCADLDAEQLAARSVAPSNMSLLGLIRHMADVERYWFSRVMAGKDRPPRFWSDAEREADWNGAVADPAVVAEAWTAWHEEVESAERYVESVEDLGTTASREDGTTTSLRSVLVHLIEEYARHCGHADLLRERIDGRVGQ